MKKLERIFEELEKENIKVWLEKNECLRCYEITIQAYPIEAAKEAMRRIKNAMVLYSVLP